MEQGNQDKGKTSSSQETSQSPLGTKIDSDVNTCREGNLAYETATPCDTNFSKTLEPTTSDLVVVNESEGAKTVVCDAPTEQRSGSSKTGNSPPPNSAEDDKKPLAKPRLPCDPRAPYRGRQRCVWKPKN